MNAAGSSEQIPPQVAAVTMAVLVGARNVREVAAACGWESKSTAHGYLVAARALGLVLWDLGKDGTLRPGVGVAASSWEGS